MTCVSLGIGRMSFVIIDYLFSNPEVSDLFIAVSFFTTMVSGFFVVLLCFFVSSQEVKNPSAKSNNSNFFITIKFN